MGVATHALSAGWGLELRRQNGGWLTEGWDRRPCGRRARVGGGAGAGGSVHSVSKSEDTMATERHRRIVWRRGARQLTASKNVVGTRNVFESCMKRAKTCRNSMLLGCVVVQ
eukprot:9329324-Alexandrium_andersonii.AAC.1